MALDFRKKQRIKKVLYSRVTLIVLVLLVLGVGRATWNVYEKERIAQEKRNRALIEYEELLGREEFLKTEIERLSTEEGIEEEIRERYGLAKEGERVIVVIDPDEDSASTISGTKGFWERVKDFFSF